MHGWSHIQEYPGFSRATGTPFAAASLKSEAEAAARRLPWHTFSSSQGRRPARPRGASASRSAGGPPGPIPGTAETLARSARPERLHAAGPNQAEQCLQMSLLQQVVRRVEQQVDLEDGHAP